jgi:hypothetical protein
MNQPPTGGSIILMQFGLRSKRRLTHGQNTNSSGFVTLLSAFLSVDYDEIKNNIDPKDLKEKVLVDTRGMWNL